MLNLISIKIWAAIDWTRYVKTIYIIQFISSACMYHWSRQRGGFHQTSVLLMPITRQSLCSVSSSVTPKFLSNVLFVSSTFVNIQLAVSAFYLYANRTMWVFWLFSSIYCCMLGKRLSIWDNILRILCDMSGLKIKYNCMDNAELLPYTLNASNVAQGLRLNYIYMYSVLRQNTRIHHLNVLSVLIVYLRVFTSWRQPYN